MAETMLGALKLAGMVSGAYVGYKYGNEAKNQCLKYPLFKQYYGDYAGKYLSKSKMTEKNFCNLTGALVLTLVGYNAWFLMIPVATYKIIEDKE